MWFDNKSWDPTLLVDKRPIIEVKERVTPNEMVTSRVQEAEPPIPGSLDWLYQDYGGEG